MGQKENLDLFNIQRLYIKENDIVLMNRETLFLY